MISLSSIAEIVAMNTNESINISDESDIAILTRSGDVAIKMPGLHNILVHANDGFTKFQFPVAEVTIINDMVISQAGASTFATRRDPFSVFRLADSLIVIALKIASQSADAVSDSQETLSRRALKNFVRQETFFIVNGNVQG